MKTKFWCWLIIVIFSISVGWAEDRAEKQKDYSPYPQPDRGYITDLADLLTPEEEERMEKWLWQTERKTNVEIVVITIYSIKDYPETENSSIESFATGLFNKYGIGNMPKNDGVLLVVAAKDRKARIELGGYYGHNRDSDANKIMQKVIVSQFKKSNYSKGITNGVKALMLEFAKVRIGVNWTLIIILIAIPILIVVAISLFRKGKKGWGWVCVGIIFVLVMIVIRILWFVAKSRGGGSSAGGFGGGFGGGSSGGGGATGSW
jgi:uncharacterized protein